MAKWHQTRADRSSVTVFDAPWRNILERMAYRDDLAAAQMKIAELERELLEANQQIAELKAPQTPAVLQRASNDSGALITRDLAGGVYYDPPQTYFPLLRLLVAAAKGAWDRVPSTSSIESDNLLARVGYWTLVWPFVNVIWRPVYVVCLFLAVLPWAALLAVAGSIVLLPLIVLARLRVGEKRAQAGTGWPQGNVSQEGGRMALWVLLSLTMPMLLPVFIPLLHSDD